jgi:hypothetical protein
MGKKPELAPSIPGQETFPDGRDARPYLAGLWFYRVTTNLSLVKIAAAVYLRSAHAGVPLLF